MFDTPSRRFGKLACERLVAKGYPEYSDSQSRGEDGKWEDGGGGGGGGRGASNPGGGPTVGRTAGFLGALGAAGAAGAGLGSAIARTGLRAGVRNAAIAAPLAVLLGGASYAWARGTSTKGPGQEKEMVDKFRSLANVAGVAGLVGLGGLLFLASRGRLRPDAAVRFAAAARARMGSALGGASRVARTAKPSGIVPLSSVDPQVARLMAAGRRSGMRV